MEIVKPNDPTVALEDVPTGDWFTDEDGDVGCVVSSGDSAHVTTFFFERANDPVLYRMEPDARVRLVNVKLEGNIIVTYKD